MNCPACGQDNRDGARFCRRCGSLLTVPAEPTPAGLGGAAMPPPPVEAAVFVPGEPSQEADAGPLGAEGQVESAGSGALPGGAERPEPAVRPSGPVTSDMVLKGPAAVIGTGQLPQPAAAAEQPSPDTPAGPPVHDEATGAEPVIPGPLPASTAADAPVGVQPPAEEMSKPKPDGVQALQLLTEGTVVGGRYAVVALLEARADETLYRARDRQGCWQCGHDQNAPDEAFCVRCGAALDRRPEVLLIEVRSPEAVPPTSQPITARLSVEGRHFLIAARSGSAPEPQGAEADQPGSARLVVGQRSDTGVVRSLNEDSLLAMTLSPSFESVRSVVGLFAVADGLGGHEGGEVASKLALQVLADQMLRSMLLPDLTGGAPGAPPPESIGDEPIVARLCSAVAAANDAIYLARQKRGSDMGTTLTAAVVYGHGAPPLHLVLAHVGDCRAYRWGAAGLQQLTTDHSLVASLVASGQVQPGDVYTHPQRSMIYRTLGDKPVVEVDSAAMPLGLGERLVLCSDGLWDMVRTEGIADVMMQEEDAQAACDLLVKHANMAGGEDNISVIVVQVTAQ